ncbi:MAG: T9SS type A sorting domain-containing protein [Bacteroidetes bacterium]|nr:T9SS type A sorting domain-containing protein [Bacteroidota bacterium]
MKHFLLFILIGSTLGIKAQVFTHSHTFYPQECNSSDLFGLQGEFHGDYFIANAIRQDYDQNNQNDINSSGAVYIYKKINDTYTQIKKLVAPDRATEGTNLWFGEAVAMHGDYLVVGTYWANFNGSGNDSLYHSGAAYIFQKNTGGNDNWGFIKKLTAPINRIEEGFFGSDVAISDSFLAITEGDAAYYENGNLIDQRLAVHIYYRNNGGNNNWGYETTIYETSNVVSYQDVLFNNIQFYDGQLILGEYGNNRVANNSRRGGRILIYEISRNGTGNLVFTNTQILKSNNDFDSNYFGEKIEISNNTMLISSTNDGLDENGNNYLAGAGAAYIAEKSNGLWSITQKLVAPVNRSSSQYFSYGVAIANDTILIAAPGYDTSINNANNYTGTVFHFVKNANTQTWDYQGNFFPPRQSNYRLKFGSFLYYNGNDVIASSGNDAQNIWVNHHLHVFTKQAAPAAQIDTTIWNGNAWGNGQPNNNRVAQIDGNITISANLTCKSLILNNNPEISISNGITLEIRGDIEGVVQFAGFGTLKIANSQAVVRTTAAIQVQNMVIDNDYNLELGGDLTVNGQLTLTNGHVVLGAYNLHAGNATTFAGGSSNSYIRVDGNGRLHATHTRGDTRFFPIGYNPYLPVQLYIPAIGNFDNREYEIGIINGAYTNPENETGALNANAVNKTWYINPLNVASDVQVTVQWPESEELAGFNRANASLSHWYQGIGQWYIGAPTAATGNDPYTITKTAYFNPTYDLWFGVGSAGSPLPVELIDFTAEWVTSASLSHHANKAQKAVQLKWKTSMELNNSHFEIEMASTSLSHRASATSGADLIWETIGRVDGNGTSDLVHSYDFTDHSPRSTDHGSLSSADRGPSTIYYRLKQIDYNGDFEYSEVRTLNFKPETRNFTVYPNPTANVLYFNTNSTNATVALYNQNGQLVLNEKGVNQISLDHLPAGNYVLKVVSNGEFQFEKVVIE